MIVKQVLQPPLAVHVTAPVDRQCAKSLKRHHAPQQRRHAAGLVLRDEELGISAGMTATLGSAMLQHSNCHKQEDVQSCCRCVPLPL
jgi:hypothetical protein